MEADILLVVALVFLGLALLMFVKLIRALGRRSHSRPQDIAYEEGLLRCFACAVAIWMETGEREARDAAVLAAKLAHPEFRSRMVTYIYGMINEMEGSGSWTQMTDEQKTALREKEWILEGLQSEIMAKDHWSQADQSEALTALRQENREYAIAVETAEPAILERLHPWVRDKLVLGAQ